MSNRVTLTYTGGPTHILKKLIASARIHHFAFVAVMLFVSTANAQVPTDVTIVNPPTNPGQVIEPRDTFPVVQTQNVSVFNGLSGVATFPEVPAGYRLIIDHVSLFGRTRVGQRLWGVIHPCDNLIGSPWGTTPLATTAIIEDPTNTNAIHSGIADTALYADPGCIFKISLQRNSFNGAFGAWVTIHGHYVPQDPRGLPPAATEKLQIDPKMQNQPDSPEVAMPKSRSPF
jgi:hypothetical protein